MEYADLVADVEGQLDGDYVALVATAVSDALMEGRTVEANYQPGDATRYGLVFVPLWSRWLESAPPRVAPLGGVEGVAWDRRAVVGGRYEYGWTLIARDERYAGGLRLGPTDHWHGSYVTGRWDTTAAGGIALALLFNKIGALL